MIKYILLAFQFLTIIPVKTAKTVNKPVNEDDIAKSASFFVLVGLIQGISLAVIEYMSGMVFHPDLIPAIVIFAYVLSNGGFHLDGLADTFDAVAAKTKGNADSDRQKRLSIMKDSSIGPIGVTAIVFALSFKYLLLKNLSHFTPFTYYSSIIVLPILSKWTMVISMFHGKAAREDGLGKMFLSRISSREVVISTLTLFVLLSMLLLFFSRFAPDFQYLFYAALIAAMYILCRLFINFFNKKFGGLTGDTLGAVSELTEIAFLLLVIVWLRLSI